MMRRPRRPRLGLIVNPIAGLGGRVGLKGTDGAAIVARALALGAEPEAPARARAALELAAPGLIELRVEVLAAPADMGESLARAVGLVPRPVGARRRGPTTAADTVAAAERMVEARVDLIVFAGGDGTARDIAGAVVGAVLALGIPAGVKMHSAVYATNPRAAAELIVAALGGAMPEREAEVMDIDEDAFRAGAVSARLYGYLRVPVGRGLMQGVKAGGLAGQRSAALGIADDVIERMEPECLYILGPGTTTRAIAERLGLGKTLLGVDIVQGTKLVTADAGERDILAAVAGRHSRIVVTPIGGQGHFLGRGNQQLSPKVIRHVGTENLIVIATPEKLASLRGEPLLVDTGDAALDRALSGYRRVITGYGAEAVCRVAT